MSIIIHVGLPKTATTFLQNFVFPNFDRETVIYNPPDILYPFWKYLTSAEKTESDMLKIQTAAKNYLKKRLDSKIILSHEGISVHWYALRYKRHLATLKQVFPDAEIIIFLRFQTDWLLSMYKQSVHQGHCQDIESFLNFQNGEFKSFTAPQEDICIVKTDVHLANYTDFIRDYMKSFSPEKVHVFFYEDFKLNPQATVNRLCDLFEVENKTANYGIYYRSLSALSIKLSFIYCRLFKVLGIEIPYDLENKTEWQKRSEENLSQTIKEKRYFSMILIILSKIHCRIRSYFTWVAWRDFLQNHFDRIIYSNWDLLKKNDLRQHINDIFYSKNQQISNYIPSDKIPKNYLSPK